MVENLTSAENTGQAEISALVQVKLRKNAVLASVFKDVTSFGTDSAGTKSISFPRRSNNFVVQKLSGAQKGDDQESTFDLDVLALTEEAHIQWAIKKFDQQRAKLQILEESIDEATYVHAVGLDADIYAAAKASIFASNKIAGPITQDKVVDVITQANTIRMPQQNRSWIFGVDSWGTLLKIDGFVDASKSNLEIVRTGQIGTLYGYPVFQSDALAAGESMLVHRDAVAYGFGAMPSLEDAPVIEYGTGSRRWVMDQLYGVKSLNEGKLIVSVGIA